jgi:hypothetical protein
MCQGQNLDHICSHVGAWYGMVINPLIEIYMDVSMGIPPNRPVIRPFSCFQTYGFRDPPRVKNHIYIYTYTYVLYIHIHIYINMHIY